MSKTILITGASRGLGLALAKTLAQQGWSLILNARGEDALEAARLDLMQYTEVIAIVGDVTHAEHRNALATAAKKLGGLDAVVNNASILGPSPQPELLNYPLTTLEDVFRTNVIAPLAVIQAVYAHLHPNASIINITSDAGVEAYPGWGGYGSSKAALEHLSRILAEENPAWRVYSVDPGDMNTQMHQEAFPNEDISDRPLPEASVPGLVELLNGAYPSGRYQAREIGQPPQAEPQEHAWLNVVVTVPNVEQALPLYRDVLGMTVEKEWRDVGHGILLNAGRATLELVDPAQAAEVDRIEVGQAVAGKVRLAIAVNNVDSMGHQVEIVGAKVVADVVDTDWGHRNQRIETANGLQITLFQESTVETEATSS